MSARVPGTEGKHGDMTIEPTAVEPRSEGSLELTAELAVKAVKAGNAKDIDIAAQIIAEHGHEIGSNGWSPEEEKKLMRKVDWRLVPIVRTSTLRSRQLTDGVAQLFVCATLSGLDKTAISAAAIYGLREDLNVTGSQYSWCGSAPFFGGLVFMGPAAYCLQRSVNPRNARYPNITLTYSDFPQSTSSPSMSSFGALQHCVWLPAQVSEVSLSVVSC
jgi:hypothetical protein